MENRLLSKKGLQAMVKMPTLEMLRGELCAILSSPAQKTSALLSSSQQESQLVTCRNTRNLMH